MARDSRFHVSDEKHREMSGKMLSLALSDGRITQNDKSLIETYLSEISVTHHISASRRFKLTVELVKVRRCFDVDYAHAELKDVYTAIERLPTEKQANGKPYKQNTISDRSHTLKAFFIWLADNNYSQIPLKKLRAIKSTRKDPLTVTAAQLLTEEEVNRIIAAAENVRDRAFLSLLYEGAFRIQEIGILRWKDVDITPRNIRINTSEKTGKPRFVPLVASRPYLIAWMNTYPEPIEPEKYVFLTLDKHHQQMNYAGAVKQIRKAVKAAGITKHVKPHLFRHSRITHLLQAGTPETVVKLLCWGDVNTNMIKTYGHLQNSDIERTIMELNGIVAPEVIDTKPKRGMKPLQCQKCGVANAPTMRFCSECGEPLTDEGRSRRDVLRDELIRLLAEDPSIMMEAVTQKTAGGRQTTDHPQ